MPVFELIDPLGKEKEKKNSNNALYSCVVKKTNCNSLIFERVKKGKQ
jgi:hypothetical protein